ncbi:MAG: hypothetical protein K2H38_06500, partial [Muribaculaceae bacterium]|nr:hypothetical protein [Muribaculaceae bacterium]
TAYRNTDFQFLETFCPIKQTGEYMNLRHFYDLYFLMEDPDCSDYFHSMEFGEDLKSSLALIYFLKIGFSDYFA